MGKKTRTPWAGVWQVRRGPELEGQEVLGTLEGSFTGKLGKTCGTVWVE